MNLAESWNLFFFAAFVVYVYTRHVYQSRANQRATVANRVGAAERFLLPAVFVGSLFLPLVYLVTPLLGFADYEQPQGVHAAGAGVMVLALWLFWRSHADLGTNWSVALDIREEHALVRQGVYRSIRHPMYAAILLFGLAQGLLLANAVAGWSALVTFLPLYVYRVPREEAMMLEFFGDDYRAYMRESGRLTPWW